MGKSDYILNEVKKHGEIKIDFNTLKSITEFKSGKQITSFESLLHILDKRQPLKEFTFDEKVFESWCSANGLQFYMDYKDLVVGIKLDKNSNH